MIKSLVAQAKTLGFSLEQAKPKLAQKNENKQKIAKTDELKHDKSKQKLKL